MSFCVFVFPFEMAMSHVFWELWAFWVFLCWALNFKVFTGHIWINWIMGCISTASTSILVNGSPTRQFGLSRGLRQGCPLSPLLFNIVGEMFAVMMRSAASKNLIEGIKVGENGLSVNVLQHADDTLIFIRLDSDKVVNIGRILRCFQLMSGFKINFGKSRLSGIGVDEQVLQIWADLLHCSIESLPCSYLGLPLGANPCSQNIWQPVIDRFNSRLSRWKGSQLSMAGRVTLIKSVLSSLPTYYMSLFPFPQGVRESLDKIQRNFLGNGTAEKRKMHLVDWKSICCPKKLGGLGIADLKLKNRALLNQWLWRFSEEEDSYWRKVIVEKYNIQNNSLLPLGINKRRCSNLWWKIIESVYVENPDFNKVKDGMRMEVGDGALINFWDDWWLKELVLKVAFPRIYALAVNKKSKIVEYGEWSEDRWV